METSYLAGKKVGEGQIEAWTEEFYREGCLFLRNVLPPDWTAELRADLEFALRENPNGLNNQSHRAHLAHRLFETSAANLRLRHGADDFACRGDYWAGLPCDTQ